MSNTLRSRAASFWVIVMILGILGCMGGVVYTFYMLQKEADSISPINVGCVTLHDNPSEV